MSAKVLFFFWLVLSFGAVRAQTASDLQLAQYYYNNAELDKALGYYERCMPKIKAKPFFFLI